MFTKEPHNSIMFLSYRTLEKILEEHNYQVIADTDKYILLLNNKEVLHTVEISKVIQYLLDLPNISYINHIRIYNSYKYKKTKLGDAIAEQELTKANLIIKIYALRYLCNELQKTNKIFKSLYPDLTHC